MNSVKVSARVKIVSARYKKGKVAVMFKIFFGHAIKKITGRLRGGKIRAMV
jgi:hypothetical protein